MKTTNIMIAFTAVSVAFTGCSESPEVTERKIDGTVEGIKNYFSEENPHKETIQAVMTELHGATGNSATSREERTANLRRISEIDVSRCPKDFRDAWFSLLQSMNDVVRVMNSAPADEGEAFLYELGKLAEGQADGGQSELNSKKQAAALQMKQALTDLAAVARSHGVNASVTQ